MHAKFESLRDETSLAKIHSANTCIHLYLHNFNYWYLFIGNHTFLPEVTPLLSRGQCQTLQLPIQPSMSHCRSSAAEIQAGKATVPATTHSMTALTQLADGDDDDDDDITRGQ